VQVEAKRISKIKYRNVRNRSFALTGGAIVAPPDGAEIPPETRYEAVIVKKSQRPKIGRAG